MDYRVWPISSELLTAAATQEDPDYEIASKHRELAPALQGFLLRVSGITRRALNRAFADSIVAEPTKK